MTVILKVWHYDFRHQGIEKITAYYKFKDELGNTLLEAKEDLPADLYPYKSPTAEEDELLANKIALKMLLNKIAPFYEGSNVLIK